MYIRKGVLLAVVLLCCLGWVQAQESIAEPFTFKGKHQPSIMILGVFHFDYPNLDAYKEKHQLDVLSAERQQELDSLRALLKAYKPTKIMLEINRVKGDSTINSRYQEYLAGTFDIGNRRDEIYQLGFKLANDMNHSRVYAVDAMPGWCGADLDWDTFDEDAYQKSLNQYEKSHRYDFAPFHNWEDSIKMEMNLVDYLRMLNEPKRCYKSHQVYLTNWSLSGAGDSYIGADSAARWYRRNIRIFSNIYDIADFNNEDRLLLIIGAGHVWLLRQLLTESPDFSYVEINNYL